MNRMSHRAALAAIALSTMTLAGRPLPHLAPHVVPHLAWDGMVVGKNGSKIRGDVAMEGGKTPRTAIVSIGLRGDTPSAVRAWHIHRGSCDKPGVVFGAVVAYKPLRIKASGEAEGMASLRIAVPDTGEYYADIHASATVRTVIACGDLLMEE